MTAPSPFPTTDARSPALEQTADPGRPAPARLPAICKQVADELRTETINAVAVTGGHLGASLGVIELTVALHYVFDTPQ